MRTIQLLALGLLAFAPAALQAGTIHCMNSYDPSDLEIKAQASGYAFRLAFSEMDELPEATSLPKGQPYVVTGELGQCRRGEPGSSSFQCESKYGQDTLVFTGVRDHVAYPIHFEFVRISASRLVETDVDGTRFDYPVQVELINSGGLGRPYIERQYRFCSAIMRF